MNNELIEVNESPNYNELKNIDGVEIVSEDIVEGILRKNFDVSEYFDYADKKINEESENEWIDLSGLVLCTEDKFVTSTLFFKNGNAIATSYCFSDGSSESSEIEDDLQGVIDLWLM